MLHTCRPHPATRRTFAQPPCADLSQASHPLAPSLNLTSSPTPKTHHSSPKTLPINATSPRPLRRPRPPSHPSPLRPHIHNPPSPHFRIHPTAIHRPPTDLPHHPTHHSQLHNLTSLPHLIPRPRLLKLASRARAPPPTQLALRPALRLAVQRAAGREVQERRVGARLGVGFLGEHWGGGGGVCL